MKEESQHPEIDSELEARIVALVLGEASDFERDEMSRLIAERPELAKLKKDIQEIHGLLHSAATGESISDDEEWKLPEERRTVVLSVIQGTPLPPSRVSIQKSDRKRGFANKSFLWKFTNIAAVLCVAAFIFGISILPFMHTRVAQVASNATTSSPSANRTADYWGQKVIPSALGDQAEAAAEPAEGLPLAAGLTKSQQAKNSKDSLLSIRGALTELEDATKGFSVRQQEQFDQSPDRSSATSWDTKTRAVEPPTVTSGSNRWFGGVSASPDDSGAGGELEMGENAIRNRPARGKRFETELKQHLGNRKLDGADKAIREDDLSLSFEEKSTPKFSVAEPQSVEYDEALFDSIQAPVQEEFSGEEESEGFAADGESMDGGLAGGGLGAFGSGIDEESDAAEGESKAFSAQQPDREAAGSNLVDLKNEDRSRDLGQSDSVDFDVNGVVDGWEKGRSAGAENLAGVRLRQDEDSDTSGNSSVAPVDSKSLGWKEELSLPQAPSDELVEDFVAPFGDAPGRGDRPPLESSYFDSQIRSKPATGTAKRIHLPNTVVDEQAKQEYDWEIRQDPERVSGRRDEDPAVTLGRQQFKSRTTEARKQRAISHDLQKQVESSLGKISEFNEIDGSTAVEGRLDDSSHVSGRHGIRRESLQPANQAVLRNQSVTNGKNLWRDYVPPTVRFNASATPAKKKRVQLAAPAAGLNEKRAEDEAFSTFSLHIGDVSFQLARAALTQGKWPEAAKIRIEEFVNAFNYGDPMPGQNEKVSCRLEQAIHPFLQQRNLLRVSMRTASAGRPSNTPLGLTFLLDNSGSMERTDRQQTVRRAFSLLTQQLKPIDRVTLISFARQPQLLADNVGGDKAQQLVQRIQNLPSEGGTNFEAALQLAFEKAKEQQVANAQNRIILLTDGAVNLGDADPQSLSRRIIEMRNSGIAFDAAGISADGLNDEVLEALARQGDGRYYLLDFPEAADDGFARQIAGALRPAAKNVKIQIEFNPDRVGRYKLLGFEKHRLKKEDFRNDKVDAAEMAAEEAGVALYQFEAKPDGEGDIGSVAVRFLDVSSGQMVENRWPIPYEPDAPRVDQAAPSLRLATTAALFAAKLRGDPLGESVDLKTLSNLVVGFPHQDRNVRIQQLQQMIQQARQLSGQ